MPKNDDGPNLWRYASAGTEFIVTFGLFLGLGLLVDQWLDALPAFTLVGAVVGFAGGLMRLIMTGRELQRRSKKNAVGGEDEKKDSGPPTD